MPIDKRAANAAEALADVSDGATVFISGFGGAGIPAFYTPVGFGTELAAGKEVRRFQDRDYVLEHAMKGDLALVRADTADRYGNLSFRYAQMNFGPVMAAAASLTIAEVRTVLDEPMPHERVQLPGVYVDRVVTVTP